MTLVDVRPYTHIHAVRNQSTADAPPRENDGVDVQLVQWETRGFLNVKNDRKYDQPYFTIFYYYCRRLVTTTGPFVIEQGLYSTD